MIGYIYKTTDLTNNKIYIGKRTKPYFQGIDYIGSGNIICRIKNKMINEGIDISSRFKVDMIDTAETINELNDKEIYWIDKLNARNPEIGYNLRKGGDCGPGGPMFAGHKHSEETKKKMSENRIGENNANYGNHPSHSDKWKKQHSEDMTGENNPMYGKKHTEESKSKNRLSHLGKSKGFKFVNKDGIRKMIPENQLNQYISEGWSKGHNPKK